MAFGMDPGLFWDLTPREIGAHMRGAQRRIERDWKDQKWMVWHGAAFIRGGSKGMPKLSKFLSDGDKKQTQNEMQAMARALHAAVKAKEEKGKQQNERD